MIDKRPIDRRRSETTLLYADDQGSVEADRRKVVRRKVDRFKVHLWVEVSVDVRGGAELTFAGDLSTQGIFLALPQPLPLGAAVTLVFTLPGQSTELRARARVASIRPWTDDPGHPGGNGFVFSLITPEDRSQIQSYLTTLGDEI